MIGSEAECPYQRPPLSKDYLSAKVGLEKVYLHEEGFYERHEIELRTATTVESVDPEASEVVLAGGERLGYDRLLLARALSHGGCRSRAPIFTTSTICARSPTPNGCASGSRGRQDGRDRRWLDRMRGRGRGPPGGTCGDMIGRSSVPLEHVLGAEVAAIYRDIHADDGVELLLGTGVEAFEGDGRVERVRTDDGREVDCDFVVAGIGATPRTAVAAGTKIGSSNGLVTNEYLETGVPGIFAAGDVANAPHPLFGRLRVEHWSNALHQGPIAARNMLGAADPDPDDPVLDHPLAYDRVPYFYSDQYDVGMEYCGHATDWDEVVLRGDVAGRK